MATPPTTAEVTVDTAKALGLTADEFAKICEIMGRTPNFTELSIYSVMWSEHCSYKNSIRLLKTLPARRCQAPRRCRRRERWPRRPRRRLRVLLQDRKPQPPLGDRAVPGCGHGRWRHPPRHLHDGRPTHRSPQQPALRGPYPTAYPQDRSGCGGRHLALRQLLRRTDRRRRGLLRRGLQPKPARQRHVGRRRQGR